MAEFPQTVSEFLQGKRLAVAGVSRHSGQAANAVFKRLRDSGYEVVPINPKAEKLEGVPCWPDLLSVPGPLDGVVIATHPDAAIQVVCQCVEKGVRRVWFHRSFGGGSVSEAALRECEANGIQAIEGGCPLMFCEPVDVVHKCMRWWLQKRGRVPN